MAIDSGYLTEIAGRPTIVTVLQATCSETIPYKPIIEYLNRVTGKYFKVVPATRERIRARWREGYRESDFRQVIATKAARWKGDPCWAVYLRPETLFGTKFEGYLNEGGGKRCPNPACSLPLSGPEINCPVCGWRVR